MFNNAQANYTEQTSQQVPQQGYAGLNTDQNAANDWARNFFTGSGNTLLNNTTDSANTGLAAMTPYTNNAADFAAGNFGTTTGADPNQVNAYNAASLNAMNSATSYGQNAQSIYSAAMTDPTQANIAAANSYMDNDVINGQIDAVNRDVSRNLNENTLPTLNMAASAGGNLNSSRAGAAEAVAQRGASDQMADNAAQIRSSAYQNGLALAEQARTSNLNAATVANNQTGNLANMGFTNTLGGMNFGENQRQSDIKAMLEGNSQLGQAASYGQAGASNATDMASKLYDLYYGAGTSQQAAQQGQYDADYQNAYNEYMKKVNANAALQQILGGNYGNDTVTTQSGGTNTTGQILGAAASAVAAYYTGGASLAAENQYTKSRTASQDYSSSGPTYSYGKALDNFFTGGSSDGGVKSDYSAG
ncbi:hypothetical protein [Roseomonas chloroacetimidivorans]|uniref:hypothetical protein n=1 Tax=Roseomonas chloroacetimidivorans TaxID=1766656 RepID=UPI003C750B01